MRPKRRERFLATVLLAHCLAGVAAAHGPEPKGERELVRLQGYREGAPAGVEIAAQIVLNILGEDHRFHLTARQAFRLAAASGEAESRERWILQGDREVLNGIASARPDQRVTLLADHRPGSSDLFLLNVDFCPPR